MSDQTSELPAPRDAAPSPDVTAPIPARPAHGLRASQIALVFVAVAAASFLVGIAIATVGDGSGDGDLLVSTDVGPRGRTIRFDGGQLTFPAGAVTTTTRVAVTSARVTDRLRVATDDDPLIIEPGELVAYGFEPTDVTFHEPVEVTFRLPEGARNGAVFVRRGDDIILLTGTIDPVRGTATTRVRDFRFGDR